MPFLIFLNLLDVYSHKEKSMTSNKYRVMKKVVVAAALAGGV